MHHCKAHTHAHTNTLMHTHSHTHTHSHPSTHTHTHTHPPTPTHPPTHPQTQTQTQTHTWTHRANAGMHTRTRDATRSITHRRGIAGFGRAGPTLVHHPSIHVVLGHAHQLPALREWVCVWRGEFMSKWGVRGRKRERERERERETRQSFCRWGWGRESSRQKCGWRSVRGDRTAGNNVVSGV